MQHTQVFCDHSKSVHLSAFKPEPLAEAHNSANRVEGDREVTFTAVICREKFAKALARWMVGDVLTVFKEIPLVVPCFSIFTLVQVAVVTILWAHGSTP